MNSHHLLLIIHLIAATIWVGGHLTLCFAYLPEALKNRDPNIILQFESKFEKVGLTSLLFLVGSGIWMSYQFGITIEQWFHFSNPIESVVSTKLSLLLLTVLFAISAQVRVIPKLRKSAEKLNEMAFHIIGVTSIGVLMLIFGSFIRYGGF